jgi:hypothetical protein
MVEVGDDGRWEKRELFSNVLQARTQRLPEINETQARALEARRKHVLQTLEAHSFKEIFMVKFIAAFLAAIAISGAAQADAFSNEDAACTGICQVHDSAKPGQTPVSAKAPVRVATPSRHTKRDAPAAQRVSGKALAAPA